MKSKSYHVSRLTFFFRYAICIALIIGGLIAYLLDLSYAIYVSALGLAVLGLVVFEFKIRSDKIVLEKDVTIVKSGVFSKNSTRINYNNIADIRVRQTFAQRVFGYGDIEMGVPGSFLQQNFSGKGDVKIDSAGLHPGITLQKFQSVRTIEQSVLSKIAEHHHART